MTKTRVTDADPLVTVIVPVCDVEDYVGHCIASLRAQTLTDFEAIVIDDGSSDASAERAADAIAGDPRFRLIRQENRGLSNARNAGLDRANGAFVAFVDSDDRVAPDYLMRLWHVLEETGGDWAACAIRSCFPDGSGHVHSAIHGAPDLACHPAMRRASLATWPDVIHHFPSAWNKLYRHDLIRDLRFDEGTWFEDHGFYLRAAARTDHLIHLPEALYLQTRGRPGQITDQDDARVFEQFDVLRGMREIMDDGGKPGTGTAFARICSRLLFERSTALRSPERRAGFARAAVEFLTEQGIEYTPDWDDDIARAWGMEMAGHLPLSVVIAWDGRAPARLGDSLASLADQPGPGREVLIVCDTQATADLAAQQTRPDLDIRILVQPGRGPGAACNHGLDAARGEFVLFLGAGDRVQPVALSDWCEEMIRHEADMGLAQFARETDTGTVYHNGFDDMRAMPQGTPPTGPLTLSPQAVLGMATQLSAKVFRRSFLATQQLSFTTRARPGWALCLGVALLAQRKVYIAWPGVVVPETPDATKARSERSLAAGHDAMLRALPKAAKDRLPDGWQRRLFARALWHQVHTGQYSNGFSFATMLAGAATAALLRGLTGPELAPAGFDPCVGPRLARLLNPLGLMGGAPLIPHPQPPEITDRLISYPLMARGTFRFRADFHEVPYANISFLARDRAATPFHLSLRFDDQCISFNDRRADLAWRAERLEPLSLPRSGVMVDICFDGPRVTVRVDGKEIYRAKPRTALRRHGFRGFEKIAFAELQGGIHLLDVVPELPNPPQCLILDSRLQLRASVAADDHQLLLDGVDGPLRLTSVHAAMGGRPVAQAFLPGHLWERVAPDAAMVLRLVGPGTREPLAELHITRDDMAARIEAILAADLPVSDGPLALQLLEHIRLGGLQGLLSPDALARAEALASALHLGDYLAAAAPENRDAAPAPAMQPAAPDRGLSLVDSALARLAQSRQSDPAPDPLDIVRDLAVPPEPRLGLFLGLTELFCRDGEDFDGLYAIAAETGLTWPENAEDAWTRSAALPYLLKTGQNAAVEDALKALGRAEGDWIMTPAIAWVMRRTLTDPAINDTYRQDILAAAMTLVSKCAENYWDRAHCRELTIAAVDLLLGSIGSTRLNRDVNAFCLSVYGLSRQFWQILEDRRPGDAVLPSEIETAKDVFRDLESSVAGGSADALARCHRALDFFAGMRCGDVARLRRECLGPARTPIPPSTAPSAGDLVRAGARAEDALRHLSFPGAAPAGDGLVDLATRAIPDLYPETPAAPYFHLQTEATRQASALIESARRNPAHDALDRLLPDLARLSWSSSHHLGAGITLALCCGLPAALSETTAAWLLSHVFALSRPEQRALCQAPAVRNALPALQRSACPRRDDLLAALTGTLPARSADSTDNAGLPAGNPVFDTIVLVFSCKPYLDTRIPALRKGWLGLLDDLGIPHVIVVGDGDGRRDGDVLNLDAPDDYEGLPQKTLAAIGWVRDHTHYAYMLKIDDDCFLNAPLFFNALSYRKFDYYGRALHRGIGQTDRTWHQPKSTTPRGRLQLDKSPEPSVYADGGSAYTLSREAMNAALEAARSPAGQRLLQVSFLEDKMVGDLLALRGIHVESEDYRVSIRRRTHANAIPVASWHNSFFASRAAPLQLLHLDTHLDQGKALERLTTDRFRPCKIWPTYQGVKLGYQSNALELITPEHSVERARDAEVAVVACMRNEMFMLPHFLAHYRALGVTSFLIADNSSDDGSLEYLAEQPDVALFSVDTDYKRSHFGVAWQQAMLAAFRLGKWSLVADADELLVWQENQTRTLPDLLADPAFKDAEAARVFMLDMYPDGPLEDATFENGGPFAGAGFADRTPFLANTLTRGPYSDQPCWTSTLRHRLIPGSRSTLFVAQKLALLRYHPFMRLSEGLHFVGDVRLAERELLFAHFKYNADFRRKARTEVARRQHFNDAEEYRKYLALASEGRSVIYDPEISVPWTESPFVRARLDWG